MRIGAEQTPVEHTVCSAPIRILRVYRKRGIGSFWRTSVSRTAARKLKAVRRRRRQLGTVSHRRELDVHGKVPRWIIEGRAVPIREIDV